MTAAWMWARVELRTRWRAWIVLGMLTGATFGLAAAGVAGARRTTVAVPRFVAASHVPTAAVLANDPAYDAAERARVAALPEVRQVFPFEVTVGIELEPSGGDTDGLVPASGPAGTLLEGVIIKGRAANPSKADEIVIDQNMARATHRHIGSTMTITQEASPAELAQLPPGLLAPGVNPNFRQTLRVVGIAKSVDSSLNWSTSGGFYAKYGHRLVGFLNEFVTLKGGEADIPRFQRDVQRIVGHPVNIESASDLDGIPKIQNITRVERDGLLLFALAVLIGGGVLVGQALARAVNAGAADLDTWRALGADRKTAIRAMVLPATVTAAVGGAVSVGLAIVLSPRFPISQARRYDLDLGFHADWSVLVLAAAATFVTVLGIAVTSALWTTSGRRARKAAPSSVGKWATLAGLPPALAIGSRLAVEPGRGRRAVPVRSALIGAMVGVLGVVGCFTFRAGLADAAHDPQRSGIVWNYVVASGEGAVPAKDLSFITHDRAVSSVMHALWVRNVPIKGVTTPTWAIDTVKGNISPVILNGRAPRSADEIAFGPGTLHALGLHIGDRVAVGNTLGHTDTVVGVALVPASSHTDYDQSALLTLAGLQAAVGPVAKLDPNVFEDYVLVKWAKGANVAAAEHHLAAREKSNATSESARVTLPTAVSTLGDLRSLPLALGVFFALLATATVAHALVTTVRRRRHELAVLRSIGFTRRQTRLAIAWQSTLLAAGGVVVGVPLGIVSGRLVWRWLAHNFPVVYVPPLALLSVVLVVPAALALANVLAAGPARSAARIRPAEALRTE